MEGLGAQGEGQNHKHLHLIGHSVTAGQTFCHSWLGCTALRLKKWIEMPGHEKLASIPAGKRAFT